jgi:uncharacterized protein YcbX
MFIKELFIYPIKGCAGIPMDQVSLNEYGLVNDRRYLVVDSSNRFYSQRNKPMMSKIRPILHDKGLTLHYPDFSELTISDNISHSERKVTIWEDEVMADDMGDEAAAWFSSILGSPARLVRIGSNYDRKVRVGDQVLSSQVHFGDSQPLLLISRASLDNLNSRLSEPLGMDRFRPNIVISGVEAHDEDHFSEIVTATLKLQFAKKCARCTVVTIDQQTGISSPEPLRTLTSYRKEGTKVFFGAYYLAPAIGSLKVGEQIWVR